MSRNISHLIGEHKNRPKMFRTRNLDVEVKRTQEDSQMNGTSTPDKKEVLLSNPMK
jgi:hypothetical protein